MNCGEPGLIAHLCTIAEGRQRLRHLADRFTYQFPHGYLGICLVPPGWTRVVERLCNGVDTLLDSDAKARFSWTRIGEEDRRLVATFAEMDRFEFEEVLEECRRFGVSLPWQRIEQQIEQVVAEAAKRARRTCEACGITCRDSGRGGRARCRIHVHTVVKFVD